MRARIKLTTVLVALASGLALLAGFLATSGADAASGTLSIGSGTAAPGAQRQVALEMLGVGEPGLGAWSIDIVYDPAVVTPVDCDPQSGSVCNPDYGEDQVRVSGAAGVGLEGDSTLAVITFQCADAEGSSPLTINIAEIADGTPGAPADIDTTVVDGTITCQAGGGDETISIENGEATVGDSDTVDLEASGIPDPGLGAWTVDISYDSSLLTAVSCTADQGGICNPAFDDGVVRVTGANIEGVIGDNRLAAITFECNELGESTLGLTVQVLVDATVGDPQDVAASVDDGSFECVEVTPGVTPTPTIALGPAGSGGPGSGFDTGSPGVWLVAGLIGAGIAWFVAGLAGVSFVAVTNQGISRLARPLGEGFRPRLRPRGEQRDDSTDDDTRHDWFMKPRR
jgi:hypothetical protein